MEKITQKKLVAADMYYDTENELYESILSSTSTAMSMIIEKYALLANDLPPRENNVEECFTENNKHKQKLLKFLEEHEPNEKDFSFRSNVKKPRMSLDPKEFSENSVVDEIKDTIRKRRLELGLPEEYEEPVIEDETDEEEEEEDEETDEDHDSDLYEEEEEERTTETTAKAMKNDNTKESGKVKKDLDTDKVQGNVNSSIESSKEEKELSTPRTGMTVRRLKMTGEQDNNSAINNTTINRKDKEKTDSKLNAIDRKGNSGNHRTKKTLNTLDTKTAETQNNSKGICKASSDESKVKKRGQKNDNSIENVETAQVEVSNEVHSTDKNEKEIESATKKSSKGYSKTREIKKNNKKNANALKMELLTKANCTESKSGPVQDVLPKEMPHKALLLTESLDTVLVQPYLGHERDKTLKRLEKLIGQNGHVLDLQILSVAAGDRGKEKDSASQGFSENDKTKQMSSEIPSQTTAKAIQSLSEMCDNNDTRCSNDSKAIEETCKIGMLNPVVNFHDFSPKTSVAAGDRGKEKDSASQGFSENDKTKQMSSEIPSQTTAKAIQSLSGMCDNKDTRHSNDSKAIPETCKIGMINPVVKLYHFSPKTLIELSKEGYINITQKTASPLKNNDKENVFSQNAEANRKKEMEKKEIISSKLNVCEDVSKVSVAIDDPFSVLGKLSATLPTALKSKKITPVSEKKQEVDNTPKNVRPPRPLLSLKRQSTTPRNRSRSDDVISSQVPMINRWSRKHSSSDERPVQKRSALIGNEEKENEALTHEKITHEEQKSRKTKTSKVTETRTEVFDRPTQLSVKESEENEGSQTNDKSLKEAQTGSEDGNTLIENANPLESTCETNIEADSHSQIQRQRVTIRRVMLPNGKIIFKYNHKDEVRTASSGDLPTEEGKTTLENVAKEKVDETTSILGNIFSKLNNKRWATQEESIIACIDPVKKRRKSLSRHYYQKGQNPAKPMHFELMTSGTIRDVSSIITDKTSSFIHPRGISFAKNNITQNQEKLFKNIQQFKPYQPVGGFDALTRKQSQISEKQNRAPQHSSIQLGNTRHRSSTHSSHGEAEQSKLLQLYSTIQPTMEIADQSVVSSSDEETTLLAVESSSRVVGPFHSSLNAVMRLREQIKESSQQTMQMESQTTAESTVNSSNNNTVSKVGKTTRSFWDLEEEPLPSKMREDTSTALLPPPPRKKHEQKSKAEYSILGNISGINHSGRKDGSKKPRLMLASKPHKSSKLYKIY